MSLHPVSGLIWIKLADYGTADISPETLGSEITMAQFTTFENVA